MSAKSSRQPEERVTTLLGAHFPEPFARQFRVRARERGMTVRALLEEAIIEKLAKPVDEIPDGQRPDIRQAD